jgi:Domain of unknown function (DUF4389)
MSDNPNNGAQAIQPPARAPFPVIRLVYSLAFGILAYFVLHLLFALALIQFIVFALNGHTNDELKRFCGNLARYLWQLATFVTLTSDEQPFPLGPFPKTP